MIRRVRMREQCSDPTSKSQSASDWFEANVGQSLYEEAVKSKNFLVLMAEHLRAGT